MLYNTFVIEVRNLKGSFSEPYYTDLYTIITSPICGRGNVFAMSMCVSVCLSVRDITFEGVDIEA